ncbi:phage tail tape measure protein [Martelella alba]|uniref:Phage tail tape measure protein n=1 Tax=Martelella alba TaxID=2590451 RepID=A0A506U2M1_9HYPH|nr:phage tail tape measure protein [Martelella alba]TPW28612.1 phage tail tape measure protein [Martelella alba]
MAASSEDRLLLRIEASLSKFEKQMARARKSGSDTAGQIERQFANSNRKMAQSAEQAASAMAGEMDRLRAKYDPLFRASKQYEAELEDLNRALAVGAINQRSYGAALETLNGRYAIAGGAVRKMTAEAEALRQVSPRLTMGIQNTAYQIGDFAVQVAAGTAASRAMAMQLPQLLGGFGVLGAVLGAVAAIAVPLASSFLDLGDSGEKVQKQISALQRAVDDYRSAVADASLPTKELAEKYGTATEAARQFLEKLEEINKVRAQQQADDAFSGIADSFGKLEGHLGGIGADGERIMSYNAGVFSAISRMSKQLDITVGQAEQLARAFDRMGEAKGPDEQVQAAQDLLKALEETLGPFDQMSAKGQDVYEAVSKAAEQASELQGTVQLASVSISTAASEAGKLADEMGRAVENAAQLAAQGISDVRRAEIQWQYRDDPVKRTGALAGASFDERVKIPDGTDNILRKVIADQRQQVVADAEKAAQLQQDLSKWQKDQATASRKSASGSKRDKGSIFDTSDDQLKRLERNLELLGKSDRQVAELEAKWSLLDAAKERGLNLDQRQADTGKSLREQIDAQAESIGNLSEKYAKAKEQAEFYDSLQSDLKDGIVDAIVEGEDFVGVLEDIAKSLAKAALQAALFNEGPFASTSSGTGSGLLGGLFSAIGGLFKSAKGSAYGTSGVKAFAKGGSFTNSVVSSPTLFRFGSGGQKTGVMGEAGKEAIMPLVRAANGDLGVKAVNAANKAGSTAVTTNNVSLGGVTVTVPEGTDPKDAAAIGEAVRKQIERFSRFELPGRLQQIQRNPNRVG